MKYEITYRTINNHRNSLNPNLYPYHVVISFESPADENRIIEIKDGIQEVMENAARDYLESVDGLNEVVVTPF